MVAAVRAVEMSDHWMMNYLSGEYRAVILKYCAEILAALGCIVYFCNQDAGT